MEPQEGLSLADKLRRVEAVMGHEEGRSSGSARVRLFTSMSAADALGSVRAAGAIAASVALGTQVSMPVLCFCRSRPSRELEPPLRSSGSVCQRSWGASFSLFRGCARIGDSSVRCLTGQTLVKEGRRSCASAFRPTHPRLPTTEGGALE